MPPIHSVIRSPAPEPTPVPELTPTPELSSALEPVHRERLARRADPDPALPPGPALSSGLEPFLEPKSVKDIQLFLGFDNFYKRLIKNFSRITAPLTLMF